jgi:hypothetical protein
VDVRPPWADPENPPEDTPSLYSYETLSLHLKEGEIVKPADWADFDEPYALSVTTVYGKPDVVPADAITSGEFTTIRKIHQADPSTGLGQGSKFKFTESELVRDLPLNKGMAAWSTAISVYEADAPDQQALEDALASAEGVLDDIATVAGLATNIPDPDIQFIAAAIQKAAEIAAGFLDAVQTFLSWFEDSDDFLGTWGISETATYIYTGSCPPKGLPQERTGTVSGTGATYRVSLEVEPKGCQEIYEAPSDVTWPVERTVSAQMDHGLNSFGIPDAANRTYYEPVVYFFPDASQQENIQSAVVWISDIEAGLAAPYGLPGAPYQPGVPIMSFQPITKRVEKNTPVTLKLPHPAFPGGLPWPFVAASDGLVAGFVVQEHYRGWLNFPNPGPGHVRYRWNLKATGTSGP